MKLFRTSQAVMLQETDNWYALPPSTNWDNLINRDDLASFLRARISDSPLQAPPTAFLAPIGSQEVWAAGVTYLRSRDARMDESNKAGASNFYDRVYDADRPELFFKSAGLRVIGPDATVRLRSDSRWQVPEPELVAVINSSHRIIGYTIGNDMSCRDIEGENPLYLPQAKNYDGSCAIGPAILLTDGPLPSKTTISISVTRRGDGLFTGSTTLAQMKRTPADLRDWLTRHLTFPNGCYLLTGTGVVPPPDFTLQIGDTIQIRIDSIGELTNTVGG